MKIPESNLAIYQSQNSFKEISSVKWLDKLFCRESVKANFSTEDKKPDIDGTFEIIKNYRFDGRLEVQIKTYNPKSSRNKPQNKLLAISGSTAQQAIYLVDIKKSKILIPDISYQRLIVEYISEIKSRVEILKEKNRNSKALQKSLINQIF